MRLAALALATVVACTAPGVFARSSPGSHSSTHSASSSHSSRSHSATGSQSSGSHSETKSHSSSTHSGTGSQSKTAPGVHRDSHGKIARDPRQTNAFKKQHPCPSTGKTSGSCPGYVIDHIKPLKRGGADSPSNMQWQTEGAAKQKDKVE
jgi:hypothetical protein